MHMGKAPCKGGWVHHIDLDTLKPARPPPTTPMKDTSITVAVLCSMFAAIV